MSLARAFHIGVVIRVVLQRFIAHVGAVMKEPQHFGTIVEVGVDQCLGHVLTEQSVRQISLRSIPRIFRPRGLGIVAVGHPDAAARRRTGAADLVPFFNQQHIGRTHFPIA